MWNLVVGITAWSIFFLLLQLNKRCSSEWNRHICAFMHTFVGCRWIEYHLVWPVQYGLFSSPNTWWQHIFFIYTCSYFIFDTVYCFWAQTEVSKTLSKCWQELRSFTSPSIFATSPLFIGKCRRKPIYHNILFRISMLYIQDSKPRLNSFNPCLFFVYFLIIYFVQSNEAQKGQCLLLFGAVHLFIILTRDFYHQEHYMILHHLLSAFMSFYAYHYGVTVFEGAIGWWISELSDPFMQIRWFLRSVDLHGSIWLVRTIHCESVIRHTKFWKFDWYRSNRVNLKKK